LAENGNGPSKLTVTNQAAHLAAPWAWRAKSEIDKAMAPKKLKLKRPINS
jgi:hypothetical protein